MASISRQNIVEGKRKRIMSINGVLAVLSKEIPHSISKLKKKSLKEAKMLVSDNTNSEIDSEEKKSNKKSEKRGRRHPSVVNENNLNTVTNEDSLKSKESARAKSLGRNSNSLKLSTSHSVPRKDKSTVVSVKREAQEESNSQGYETVDERVPITKTALKELIRRHFIVVADEKAKKKVQNSKPEKKLKKQEPKQKKKVKIQKQGVEILLSNSDDDSNEFPAISKQEAS